MAEATADQVAHISAAPSCDPASAQAVQGAMVSHCTPLPSAATEAAGAPTLTVEDVRLALKRSPRSKSPGPDGIPAGVGGLQRLHSSLVGSSVHSYWAHGLRTQGF